MGVTFLLLEKIFNANVDNIISFVLIVKNSIGWNALIAKTEFYCNSWNESILLL